MKSSIQILFSLVWSQIMLVSEIQCVNNGNSQHGYGSQDFGYGPFHADENSGPTSGNSYAANSNKNANGMSPFASSGAAISSSTNMSPGGSGMSSPFTANSGQDVSSGASGMQSSFSAGGASSSTGGMSASPFSTNNGGSGTQGSSGVSSPFSVGGTGKGGGTGNSPFSAAMGSGTDSGPFAASGNLGGTDMSSLFGSSSGPGGLTGGTFGGDTSLLSGHDFSADLVGSSLGGVYTGVKPQYSVDGSGSKGQSQYGIDTSKFDTSEYQKMLDQLFNPQTYDKGLLASPFHGDTYKLPQGQNGKGQGQGYQNSHESSVGSYASTNMGSSAYAAHSGSYQGSGNSYSGSQGYNVGSNSGTGQGHSGSSSGIAQNPFDTSRLMNSGSNTYATNGQMSSSSTGGSSGMNVDSPFKITNAEKGDTPFKVSSSGQGVNPFKTTDTNQGGNPFDTTNLFTGNNYGTGQGQSFQSVSGGQVYDGGAGLSGGTQFHGSSGTTHKNGLDAYGNVDFSKLSGLTGSGVDFGTGGTSYGSAAGTGSYPSYSGSSYTSHTGNKPSYTSVNTGVSESQYKTPFESDNYNDLLGNPFDSSSNFNSNHESFNQPYSKGPAQSGGLQTYQGSSGSAGGASGYSGSSGYAQSNGYGQGPAGDPFQQGGSRMNMNRG